MAKVQHRNRSTKSYFAAAFDNKDNRKITLLVYDLLSQKFKIKSLYNLKYFHKFYSGKSFARIYVMSVLQTGERLRFSEM
jgi:hypothetical protein